MVTATKSAAQELTSVWLARLPRDGRGLEVTRAPECSTPSYVQRGRDACLFAGILNNRNELRAALGHHSDDAALVLAAYAKWGPDCPNHVRGIFAFVIWDSSRNVTFGARDRLGIHPLFWAFAGHDLLFSPSISALVADPDVSREFNRAGIVDHLRHTWGDHPTETFYTAVSRVPSGHAFEAAGRDCKVWPYWKLLQYPQQADFMSEAEIEGFDEQLDRSVERCLRLGDSGIFLSGGLDSVSIAASAIELGAARGYRRPVALSLELPHPDCNEASIQRGVAARLGLEQVLLNAGDLLKPEGLLWSGLMLGSTLEAPLGNMWAPAFYKLRLEARRRGCDVIMTGNGGDDWLSLDPRYVADLMRTFRLREVVRLTRSQMRSFDKDSMAVARRIVWGYGVRPLLNLYGIRVLKQTAPSVIAAHRRRAVARITPPWLAPDPELQKQGRERFDRVQDGLMKRAEPAGPYGFFLSAAPVALIRPSHMMEFEEQFELGRKTGPLEMAPYWDADLVEFVNRIPPSAFDKGGRSKALVRDTVAKRFPGLGFDRQRKVSALNYFGDLLETEGPAAWTRLGGASSLENLGIVGLGTKVPACFGDRGATQFDRIVQMHRIVEVLHAEAWLRARPRMGPGGQRGQEAR